MNLEDSKIKAAFIRGFLNKQAESGLDKQAFIAPLLSLLGSVGGQQLGARYLTPKLVGFAEKQLAGRAASRIAASGKVRNPALLSAARRAKLDPGATSRIGKGYDKFLNHLSKPMGPASLTSRGAGAWAENIGLMGGGALGGVAGSMLESEDPNLQEEQQYQQYQA